MNNKTLIIVIGVVVVIGAIIGFMMMRGNPVNTGTPEQAANTQTGSQKMSMKSLLAAGKAQTCSFSNTDGVGPDASSSGTMQIADGKMRGDFTATVSGKTVASHMIMMDNTNYIWGDGMQGGIKMTITDLEKPENQKNQAIDLNKETNYSCTPGTNDPNAFNLPAGIEFKDMSALIKDMMPTTPITTPGSGSTNTSQCGMCDQAPDADSRAQCRTALGCK